MIPITPQCSRKALQRQHDLQLLASTTRQQQEPYFWPMAVAIIQLCNNSRMTTNPNDGSIDPLVAMSVKIIFGRYTSSIICFVLNVLRTIIRNVVLVQT